jgi:hypothetical protein
MRNRSLTISIAASALMIAIASAGAPAAPPPASTSAAKAKPGPPAPPDNAISYEDLRQHIGAVVIVHTTFKTTRAGVLLRFSNTEIALQVDTPSGPTEFTIPKNTVSSVALPAVPVTEPGKPSAKKN